ncbi:MAG: PQQ-dependent sugar dehydrogenase [Ignavibacteria bacterium]
MRKLHLLLATIILMISAVCNAQYKLQSAFPTLLAFNNPVELVNAGDGSNRLFVLQQNGAVYVFNNSPTATTKKIFIDLTSKVTQGGSETGLLGMAFHPDYKNNRYFFVSYTFDSTGNGSRTWSRVSRFRTSPENPDTVLLSTEEIFITINQPDLNHKGGKIAFGPDGLLYLSFGDGGGEGDPFGFGQNKSTLLGKILRINIDSAGVGRNYSIPPSNPFYGTGYKEEIYAYGFRNTWKFSIDFPTNTIWGGDVGQETYEEVNIIQSGKNYGWNKMEGLHCFGTCDTTGKGFTRPIFEYQHNVTGNSITGGYVYRGSLLPGLYGKYIYGDFVFGRIWALTYDGTTATNVHLLDSNYFISSFGVDENNEIYVCRYSFGGRIYKIVDIGTSVLNLKAAIEGYYDTTAVRLNMKDTLSVYLRQNISPFNLIDSAKTVIDSLSFSGLCFFHNALSGKYYIQLKHRNALEVWSKAGGDSVVRGVSKNYDFTSGTAQTFGANAILIGGKSCIYSGDVIEYGAINLTDIVKVYNDQTSFLTGYQTSDLNGNGAVDLTDLVLVFNNATKFISVIKP